MNTLYHTYQMQEESPSTSTLTWVFKNWFQLLCLGLILHLLFSRDISIQFNMQSADDRPIATQPISPPANVASNAGVAVPTSYHTHTKAEKQKPKDNRGNTFANLTFILSPDYAERKNIDPAVVRAKKEHVYGYIKQYKEVALKEMEQYGIPASITLAQGLLESNAGDSRLSSESNNHFGIKCRSKCKGCTCRNYTDDDVYDMFRVFNSSWESYREHSRLLTSKRYKHLLKLKKTDYKKWAHGLKKAGYATDKRYAEKLIKIIETLKLYRLDRM